MRTSKTSGVTGETTVTSTLLAQIALSRRHELFDELQRRVFRLRKLCTGDGYPGFCGEVHHRKCYCLPHIEWRCGQLKAPCHRHRTHGFVK